MSELKKPAWKFVVEFGDNTLRNFVLSSLKVRCRGAFDKAAWHSRPGGGADLGVANGIQDLPGQRLEVDCRHRRARLFDPLDPVTIERHNSMARVNASINQIKPVAEVPFELTPDLLKTLLVELCRMAGQGQLKVISGELPTVDQLEGTEGKELYDNFNSAARKPRYREDIEAWEDKVLN